eukprot:5247932-Prymnesium_polylepis.1
MLTLAHACDPACGSALGTCERLVGAAPASQPRPHSTHGDAAPHDAAMGPVLQREWPGVVVARPRHRMGVQLSVATSWSASRIARWARRLPRAHGAQPSPKSAQAPG